MGVTMRPLPNYFVPLVKNTSQTDLNSNELFWKKYCLPVPVWGIGLCLQLSGLGNMTVFNGAGFSANWSGGCLQFWHECHTTVDSGGVSS